MDGCRTRYPGSGRCTECVAYLTAIRAGRIVGTDGRGLSKKEAEEEQAEAAQQQNNIRSEAIRRGREAAKERRQHENPPN